jgi:ubiquinone/menaquinone biosynthesis C-methylase UbiE
LGAVANWLFSRLLDFAMRNRALDRYRPATVGPARGVVLEIGVGSGLNLGLYPANVHHVYALDPSAELLAMARRRAAQAAVPVSFVRASAEQLPFPDTVFDTVVMTWTLCSIRDPVAALREMRRVLKPGGQVLFVEHGLSPEPGVARWQHRLTPCWSRVSGGCHLGRKTDDLIRAAGFEIRALETGYMRGPKPWTYMYQGASGAAVSPKGSVLVRSGTEAGT